jgi:cyanamide hydratase
MRVYHYGLAIKQYRFPARSFPDWDFDHETYFLACVLHDIGTTKENLRATRLSFEFLGGMLALRVLQDVDDRERVEIGTGTGIDIGASAIASGAAATATDTTTATNANATAPREQAESVAEAIIRHQDLCHVGKITVVGQLLQLATIFGKCCTSSPFSPLFTVQAKPRLE